MTTGVPGSKAPHGTQTRYNSYGCRCDACTRAHREASRIYYDQQPRETWLAAVEPAHGTESRYNSTRFHCRCDNCREASRVARARRRATAKATA